MDSTNHAQKKWSTKKIAVCAVFCALAMVASFIEFPIFFAAPYLKYDPSGIVAIIATMAFGGGVGSVVAILPWAAHAIYDPIGSIMAISCSIATIAPIALIYKGDKSIKKLIVALVASSLLTIIVAIAGNLLLTPLYSGMPASEVAKLIVPVLIPFNIIKVLINSIVTIIIQKPVMKLCRRYNDR